MVRLPLSLQRKLSAIFPDAHDQSEFVAEVIEKAIDTHIPSEKDQPQAIGGTMHLFSDGGSRGNPGQAAVGCVLLDPFTQEIVREHGECIGIETNNIAEYRALITGLKIAEEFHPNHLICHLDSELVVKQLNGEYRVKMATFTPLIQEINERKSRFEKVSFVYIPREKNAKADALVNKALDQMIGKRVW